jgi:predicted PurR-regulated permease PerM
VNIPTRTILKILLVTATFVGLIYFVYLTRTILVWVVTAFSLALALNPAVAAVERKIPGHHRITATLLVFLTMLAAMVGLGVTLLPPVVVQTEQLIFNLPQYTEQISREGTPIGDFVNQYDLITQLQNSQSELISRLTNASGTFVGILTGIFSSLIAVLSIFGLTFFMLMEGPSWLRMFWNTVPLKERSHGQQLAAEMYRAMVGYVNGKLLAAFLAGLSAAIMLIILQVPYAAALALVVAILSIIPVFGATIAAVIVVIIALFHSPGAALAMTIFFIIYQQVENNIIQPVIFNRTVDVSPLLVFISVLMGTAVGGILGALIAIPVTASIQILVRDYYKRRAKHTTEVTEAKA